MAWWQVALEGKSRLEDFLGLTADFNIGGGSHTLLGLRDASASGEPVTFDQWQAGQAGLTWKLSARVATTGNLTLTAPGATIDGITMVSGDRVFVKDQSTAAQNGIYLWNGSSSTMTRTSDADAWDDLVSAAIFIEEGSTHADTGHTITVNGGGTLGSTDVTTTQFTGAASIGASEGVTKSGNDVILDFNGLTTDASPATNDIIAFYDGTQGEHNKMTFANLKSYMEGVNGVNHDTIQGSVSEEHIRWDLTGAEDIHGDRVPNLSWNIITSDKPTTVAGYGITDGLTDGDVNVASGVAGLDGTSRVAKTNLPTDAVYDADLTAYAPLASPAFTGSPTVGGEGILIDTDIGAANGVYGLDATGKADPDTLGTNTLAAWNTHITDATLDDAGDARPPTSHAYDSHTGTVPTADIPDLSGEYTLDQWGGPAGPIDMGGQPFTSMVYQNWANDGARPGSPFSYQIGFNISRGFPEIWI